MQSRRNFLTSWGLVGGAVALAGGGRLAESASPRQEADASRPILGERFAGFAILPEGAPEPFDVVPPARIPPIFFQVGEGGPRPTGFTDEAASPLELEAMSGMPVWSLAALGVDVSPIGGSVLRYTDGDVFAAVLTFESRDEKTDRVEPNIRLQMQRYFPQPVPLWESTPAAPGEPFTAFRRVGFLPSPGLVERSGLGYIFHWIKDDVYYRLFVENQPSFGDARRIAGALEKVGGPVQRPLEH
jgi:hypothetical protein